MAETHASTDGYCISIDSFRKKRTGFGPHSCDDAVHDYIAADEIINLMRRTLRLLSIRYPSKQAIVSFDARKIPE